jgi:hypothetical protein
MERHMASRVQEVSNASLSRKWNRAKAPVRKLREALEKGEGSLELGLGVDVSGLGESERRLLAESLSDVQVQSKLWLLDHLFDWVSDGPVTFLVLGGWCGVLPWLANVTGRGRAAKWISIDVDYKVGAVGGRAFARAVPNLSFVCDDIYDLDYDRMAREHDLVVINTICEHLHEVARWRSRLPSGTTTLLQSNNYRGCRDHVNCVDSADELRESARLNEVFFQGSLRMSLFTRFMVIGRT